MMKMLLRCLLHNRQENVSPVKKIEIRTKTVQENHVLHHVTEKVNIPFSPVPLQCVFVSLMPRVTFGVKTLFMKKGNAFFGVQHLKVFGFCPFFSSLSILIFLFFSESFET